MRKTIFILVLTVLQIVAEAQVQEIEQLKLDLEKLLQLKLMLSQAKQGYQNLLKGYDAVRDGVKGNFNLHKNYLDGLLQISPQVRNAPALKRLGSNQSAMTTEYRNWYNKVHGMGLFRQQELLSIQQRYREIETAAQENLDQLALILSNGTLRMSDAERVTAIEMLAAKSDEYLHASHKLIQEQTMIAARRAKTAKDIEAVKRLYGLP